MHTKPSTPVIPAEHVPEALAAVVDHDVDTLAFRLGVSGPALVQEVLRLIDEPSVIVANPRPCRILRERREAGRALRSRFRLTARSEV